MKKKLIKILNREFTEPITCLTSYSSSITKLLDGEVDMILVGDSLGSTLYGMKNTQGVSDSTFQTRSGQRPESTYQQ